VGIATNEVIAASRVTSGIADGKEFVIRFGRDVSHYASPLEKEIFNG
jgi:hypothetical protein